MPTLNSSEGFLDGIPAVQPLITRPLTRPAAGH